MPDVKNKTILIVDDEQNILDSLSRYLRSEGFTCVLADSALKALKVAAHTAVDIMLTDVYMGGMDGVELVKRISREHPNIECVVMTGHPDTYRYIDIIHAGAKDFLLKPFDNEELKAKLERVQKEHETTITLRNVNASLLQQVSLNHAYSELCRSLIRSMPIEEMSSLVLECAKNLTASQIGYAGFIDRETNEFQAAPGDWALREECRVEGHPSGFGHASAVWAWMLENKKPLLINAFTAGSPFNFLPEGHIPLGRFLAVPVLIGQEPRGMIALAESARDYAEDDVLVLQDIAGIYSIAIKRRWDEVDLEKANHNLTHLLDMYTNKFNAAGLLLKRSIDLVKGLHGE